MTHRTGLDRLIGFEINGCRTSLSYDPLGRRIERCEAGKSTRYLYQFDTEIGEWEDGSFKTFRAIREGHAPFAIELDGDIYNPIRNHRGDVSILLDTLANPITTYHYDAFGEFTSHGAVKSPWLFSGQRYDAKIGLYHFAKREYDPIIGRWLTPDPLGFADGPNLYAYVHNNPLINVDPYGLWGESLSKWYKNTMQFTGSFTRGFADDTTFGATGYMFGERSHSSISSKIGYYTGTGCSMAAGLMYGGTWLKGARYGGKVALNAYKLTRGANTAAKTTKNVLATKRVVKLAQETKPMFQRVAESSEKLNHLQSKKMVINLASSKRTNHILLGDVTGGGHLWPGIGGKSTFPKTQIATQTSVRTDRSVPDTVVRIEEQG